MLGTGIAFVAITIGLIGFFRNIWVFNTRKTWLRNCKTVEDLDKYDSTVYGYDAMMFRLLNWSRDINKWKKNG